MKISIFTDVFFPLVNGVVTSIVNTVKILSEKNHKMLIFAPKHPKIKNNLPFPNPKNPKIHYLTSFPGFLYPDFRLSLPISLKVFTIINNFQPDIIHFHSPGPVSFNGILAAKKFKIPLVGSFHAYIMEPEYLRIAGLDKIYLDNNPLINGLMWAYSNMFFNRTDTVICPSKQTKSDLIKHGMSRPIRVISNGINISSNKNRDLLNYDLPEQYFLYVGRISKEKSLDVLINSFNIFAQKINGVHLLIVGGGPIEDDLKKLTRSFSLAKRVHFLRTIDHERLMNANIYQNAIAFVTTSKSETQCISILEAMKFGLPIIGVKARAVPELIKDNGILCQPDDAKEFADALFAIVSNPNLRNKFRKQSLKMVKQHSIQKSVEKLESLYNSLSKNKTHF